MKRIIIFQLLCCLAFTAWAQLTIEECQQKAQANYPLIKRYNLIEKSKDYNLSNAGKGYLPQVSISGKASWQSQVTELPVNIPGMDIKKMNKDQYGATIDVSQIVWDGGTISSRKEIIETSSKVESKQLDVDMYTINKKVNDLFFGILLLDAKIKQNDLLREELQRNYNTISSYIDNGVANQADLDAVKVELLNTRQNKVQLESNRKSYIDMLAILIGENLNDRITFQKPQTEQAFPIQNNRPELFLYDAQLANLEAQKKSIKTNYMPKLSLFATGGYANPALNMLKPDFSAYFIGGIRLSWNFGSLYTKKNDNRLIEVNKSNVEVQRETFLFNNTMEISQEQKEISKNIDLLKYDDEIINLRNNVKKAAEVKVANGIITVTDLLKEVTSEDMAKQDKIQHEIELLQSVYNLKYTTNN